MAIKGFLGKIYFQRDELCILKSLTIKHIKFKRQGRRISSKEKQAQSRTWHKNYSTDNEWGGSLVGPQKTEPECWRPAPFNERGEHYPSERHDSLEETLSFTWHPDNHLTLKKKAVDHFSTNDQLIFSSLFQLISTILPILWCLGPKKSPAFFLLSTFHLPLHHPSLITFDQ